MQSCWKSEPEDRPQFSELVSTISDILQSTAGYVEFSKQTSDTKTPRLEDSAISLVNQSFSHSQL